METEVRKLWDDMVKGYNSTVRMRHTYDQLGDKYNSRKMNYHSYSLWYYIRHLARILKIENWHVDRDTQYIIIE